MEIISNTNSQPLISVVIPFYNDGEYIDEAVDSILEQTYTHIEIIIVNDGSTDPKSIEKLANYQRPKTKVLHKENGHLASARNYGIRYARGEYVLLLDADDKFEKTFIEKAKSILDNNKNAAAVSAYAELFGRLNNIIVSFDGGTADNFVFRNNAVACALIRKRVWEEVGGYNEDMQEGFEDWDFWLSVTQKGWEIKIIPEPLFKYRQKTTSMLQDSQKKRPELIRFLVQRHEEVFREHVVKAIYERELMILKLKQNFATIQSSRSYKLAKYLLLPFSFIKKMSKNLKTKIKMIKNV